MAEKSFSLEFDGYWRLANISSTPEASGVYTVYCSTYDTTEKTLSIRKLVYIGESQDVNQRLTNHEKLGEWKQYLKSGETLCFGFAPVSAADRVRCEAALINHHTPPVNTEYTDAFPFDRTSITTKGKSKYLTSSFSVERDD